MPFFTAQQIIDRAASQADIRDAFVTPTEWLAWMNSDRQALALYSARAGWALESFTESTNVSTVNHITLPEATMAIVGVWEVSPEGRYRKLTQISPVEAVDYRGRTGTALHYSVLLDVAGVYDDPGSVAVLLHPSPTSGTYRAAILPSPAELTSLADSVFYPGGVEEALVLKLARRARIKEEGDPTSIDRLLTEAMAHVEEIGWSRTLAEAPVMRNMDAVTRGWSSNLIFPAVDSWIWF